MASNGSMDTTHHITPLTTSTAGGWHARRPVRMLIAAGSTLVPGSAAAFDTTRAQALLAVMRDCHALMQRMAHECDTALDDLLRTTAMVRIDAWHGPAGELYRERIRALRTQAAIIRAQGDVAPAMLFGQGTI